MESSTDDREHSRNEVNKDKAHTANVWLASGYGKLVYSKNDPQRTYTSEVSQGLLSYTSPHCGKQRVSHAPGVAMGSVWMSNREQGTASDLKWYL